MKNISITDLVPVATLVNIARRVRQKAAEIARSKNVPLKSANEIGIREPKVTQGQTQINLSLSDKLAAYEYGSGIHRKGGGRRYPIEPDLKESLSFPGTNQLAGYQIVTKLVMHPGVAARPFMGPAKRATRQQNLEELRQTNLANTRLIIKTMVRKV